MPGIQDTQLMRRTSDALDVLLKAQEDEGGDAQQHELVLHAVHRRQQASLGANKSCHGLCST